METDRNGKLWFKGFWTFFFQAFYIQFKINKLRKAEQTASCNPAPQDT